MLGIEKGSSHSNGIAKRHHNLLTKIHECNVEKSFLKYSIISYINSSESPKNTFEYREKGFQNMIIYIKSRIGLIKNIKIY